MRDEKEERKKQARSNKQTNKAKQVHELTCTNGVVEAVEGLCGRRPHFLLRVTERAADGG